MMYTGAYLVSLVSSALHGRIPSLLQPRYFLSVSLEVCLGYMIFVLLEVKFRQSAKHLA